MERGAFKQQNRAIIAMKGLPCTGKTRVAEKICNWAKRPALYIDDFIGSPDNNIADSWEEAERLQASVLEQAFTTLRRVATSQLNSPFYCVVIKSRLCSTFELEQLFQLSDENWGCVILIVECKVRNKHQWQKNFNAQYYKKTWNRPRRWNDVEKARDDHYNDPQALAEWDLHLLELIQRYAKRNDPYNLRSMEHILVRRLVVDPYYDLDMQAVSTTGELNPIFAHAINHLISATLESNSPNPFVVDFDEFRKSRAKEILTSTAYREAVVCGARGCLFKYLEELRGDDEGYCGVCEEKLVSGQPAYTCHYCILTLHKQCAEMTDHFDIHNLFESSCLFDYIYLLPTSKKHACNRCTKIGFDQYCLSCRFQTVLKGRLLPPVVNHDRHPHPLSVRIENRGFICKACGFDSFGMSYVCRICEWYYHIQCLFSPKQVKHEHGGHEHVLKLKYSQDDTEQEDYWCDVCFEDLDPYFWFYSCQSCPYYASHLSCAGVYPSELWKPFLSSSFDNRRSPSPDHWLC